MTFLEHLEELRFRLIKSALALIVFSGISFLYRRDILEILKGRYFLLFREGALENLVSIYPAESFVSGIKLSLFGGMILSFPYIAYQALAFILPGLKKTEKKFIFPLLLSTVFFFLSGALTAYLIILPAALNFLLNQDASILNMTSVNSYITFSARLIAAFGFAFEIPVLCFILARSGIVTTRVLLSWSKYAIIMIFVLSAILTPPDVVSQIMLAVPLILLYFLGIAAARFASGEKNA
ncbi:MAG: twin-arginine translocase subunit TatC [Fibrobacterota bacterium]